MYFFGVMVGIYDDMCLFYVCVDLYEFLMKMKFNYSYR